MTFISCFSSCPEEHHTTSVSGTITIATFTHLVEAEGADKVTEKSIATEEKGDKSDVEDKDDKSDNMDDKKDDEKDGEFKFHKDDDDKKKREKHRKSSVNKKKSKKKHREQTCTCICKEGKEKRT